MKKILLLLASFMCTTTFAFSKDPVVIVNNTQRNVYFQYTICEGNDCTVSGGGHLFLIGQSPVYYIYLDENETININHAEEVDAKGWPIPNGIVGSFTTCKAKEGQVVDLNAGLATSGKEAIFCHPNSM